MNIGLVVSLIMGGLLIIVLLVPLLTPRSRTKTDTPTVFRDDDQYWLAGFLYNNPDDPALFVPKRFGLGRTVNIGHPLGKLIMIGLLLLVVVMALLTHLGVVPTYGCHPSGCHW